MITADALLPVVLASLVVVASPGPGTLYVVGRTLASGRRAGLAASLGLNAAAFVHVLAGAVGVSALLAAWPAALTAVRVLGALYLVRLAVAAWRSATAPRPGAVAGASGGCAAAFRGGFMVDLLNPEVALFFLTFLPPFVDPAAGQAAAQFALLGGAALVVFLAWDTLTILAIGAVGRRPVGRLGRAQAAMFLGLAAWLALPLL